MKFLIRSQRRRFQEIFWNIFVLIWSLSRFIDADQFPTCQAKDFHYEFTECDEKGGRWRVSVPKPDYCIHGAPNPPTRITSCTISCDSGQFYDPDNLGCENCSAGTYSLGGEIQFGSWEKLPSSFHITQEPLLQQSSFRARLNVNCSNFGWLPRGDFIMSKGGPCTSTLMVSVKLVRPGSLTYTYQYSDRSILFEVQVQNDKCQSDDGSDQNGVQHTTLEGVWKTVKIPLNKGLNVLHWKTVGIEFDANHRVKPVLIRNIHIDGVAYTSVCTRCPNGTYSSNGAKTCTPCPANTYSERGASNCTKCKDSQYASEGSNNCTERLKCTDEDYYEIHSPCSENNTMQIIYKWIQPKICRSDLEDAAKLPKLKKFIKCLPCSPGMQYINSSRCIFCPPNHYSNGDGVCKQCPPSTAPNYGYHLLSWNNLPPGMDSTCISATDTGCSESVGWEVAGDHIVSRKGNTDGVLLILSLRVPGFSGREGVYKGQPNEIGRVSFTFELNCTGNCELVFMQSGAGSISVIQSWNGSQPRQHYSFPVMQNDSYLFSWAFQKVQLDQPLPPEAIFARHYKDDVARIFTINVTNTVGGGASTCIPCPQGVRKDGCIPCQPGHYIDRNTSHCKPCPPNTFVSELLAYGIESCTPCGPGLQSSNGQACYSNCSFSANGSHFDLTSLAGYHLVKGSSLFTASGTQYYHLFNITLCGKGILESTICSNNISIHSPDLEMEEVRSILCRSTIIPPKGITEVPLSSQSVSLGDQLLGVTTNNYLGRYKVNKTIFHGKNDGNMKGSVDLHFFYSSSVTTRACQQGRYSTITLRCDTNQKGSGMILLPPSCPDGTCDGCNYHFLWLTRHACPVCTESDYEVVKGECIHGKQTLHYIPPNHCLLPSWVTQPSNQIQKCSSIPKELQIATAVAAAVGLLLIVLVIYFWKKNQKLEYKYMKLVQSSSSKDGELPPAESCAIDDEDDDHFDSIQFKESKSKMLLNKIRAMAGNKNESDNPFETIQLTEKDNYS